MSFAFRKNAESSKSRSTDTKARSDPLLLPVGRRQSKGGLRDLFTKNRSTRTIAATPEQDETMTIRSTSTSSLDKTDPSWTPPPLFQAFPQSIKHAQLETSNVSAPTLLRLNEQQQKASLDDDLQLSKQNPSAAGGQANVIAQRNAAVIAHAGWTRKIYVLTTTGHLLQYAGDGTFDRKPEKVLQLNRHSTALVSDTIHGRPYVLHVSQSSHEPLDHDSQGPRRILTRIGIRNSSARRSAGLLFLIFDAADELESWWASIQKAIREAGGQADPPERMLNHNQHISTRFLNQCQVAPKSPDHSPSALSPTDPTHPSLEQRSSTQSSNYTATDLERLRDSKTSNATTLLGTAASSSESPPPSPGQDKLPSTEAPHLVLPELESSPPKTFPRRKRQSRFPLPFSETPATSSAAVKPTSPIAQQESLPQRLGTSGPVVSGSAVATEPIQGKIPDGGGQNLDVDRRDSDKCSDSSFDQRTAPTSPSAPVPSVPPPPSHTGRPEPSTGSKYSLFPTISETAHHPPKRYSSLEYSPAHAQLRPSAAAPSVALGPANATRRPTSLQVRRESLGSVERPAGSPCALDVNPSTPGEETVSTSGPAQPRQPSTQPGSSQAECSFGPPACPPPSGPLPALPAKKTISRRQRSVRVK